MISNLLYVYAGSLNTLSFLIESWGPPAGPNPKGERKYTQNCTFTLTVSTILSIDGEASPDDGIIM
jgi:hypothetical protein